MTKATDKQGTKHAREFLKAVKKALKHAKEINKTVSEWGPDYERPPLLKANSEWDVDDDEFEAFELLIDFMCDALFGVDCDNDSAVLFEIINRKKHENFLSACRVPRVDWDDTDLLKKQRQLELAQIVVRSARSRMEGIERCFNDDVRRNLKLQLRLKKAKGCETCKSKGWVDTDFETWNALKNQDKYKTESIGCNPRINEKPKWKGPKFRLFCECQKDDDEQA